MSYKTIVLHCNDQRRIPRLLSPTLALADRFQSHVIGLSVVPPISAITTGAIDAPPIIVDAHCELYRQENALMRRQFEEAIAGRSFTAEWRDADAGAFGVVNVVLDHGRAADLIVASQTDREWATSEWLDVADRVAVESGRPTLIIPNASARNRIGSRVLIAWNGRREAAQLLRLLQGMRDGRGTLMVCSRLLRQLSLRFSLSRPPDHLLMLIKPVAR